VCSLEPPAQKCCQQAPLFLLEGAETAGEPSGTLLGEDMAEQPCASREQLQACLVGKLPAAEAESLFSHLEGCATCRETLLALGQPTDTLVNRLRRPRTRDPYLDEPQCQAALKQAKSLAGKMPPTGEEPSTPAARPRQLGDYELLEKLGEGGMGAVYKARHRTMDRLVAVKLLPARSVQSADLVKRFYQEVKAAAKLIHPNVVTAFDAGQYEGVHYLVMEYVEGRDLARLIKQRGPLSVANAVNCILQAARGLQYAHAQGVIHRDIKPANLLLDRSGTVKILDMGLARVQGKGGLGAGEPDEERLTESGQVMGTCDYMAPEQALNTHQVDARADIYSLGCTLYRLLTGTAPYHGDSLIQVLLAHREAPIPSLCAARLEVPAALDAIYQRMVAKQPEDRYPSMAEVVAALEAFARAERAAAGGRSAMSRATAPAVVPRPEAFGTQPRPQPVARRFARLATAVRNRKPLAIGLTLVGSILVTVILLSVWIRIRHRDGQETALQVSPGSQVVIDRQGNVAVTLPKAEVGSGKAEVGCTAPLARAAGEGPGVRAASPCFDAAGNWKLPPDAPPPAVAPFDATKAKEHQAAWAKYLGVPVEMTNSIGMRLVLVPPGEFDMGMTPEELNAAKQECEKAGGLGWYLTVLSRVDTTRHRVHISRPFYLGKFEVTQGEYQQVMGENPSKLPGSGKGATVVEVPGQDTPQHPVRKVMWTEATEFCRRLSTLPGKQAGGQVYRLPTEAQWEYACRAGTTTWWSGGNDPALASDEGWVLENAPRTTHPVGQKRPNAWGLHDLHGNVEEWCADAFDSRWPTGSVDPLHTSGAYHVFRGGSCCWETIMSAAPCRMSGDPQFRHLTGGFRVVREIATKAEQGGAKTDALPKVEVEKTPRAGKSEAQRWDFDLLSRVNLARDRVEGQWKREGERITTTGTGREAVRLPLSVQGDYDLELVFTRNTGVDAVGIEIPIGSHEGCLLLSGWKGEVSGFQPIDRRLANENPTGIKPGTLVNGHRYTLLMTVRVRNELVTVESFLDGTPFVRWQGKESSLVGVPARFRVWPCIGLFTWPDAQVTFHSAKVRIVSGTAQWTDEKRSGDSAQDGPGKP